MPPAPPRLRFPKGRRLRRQSDFLRLKSGGRRLVSGCVVLNWAARPLPTMAPLPHDARPADPSPGGRLGVITSRKVGGAVVRNRARRWVREVYRRHQHALVAGTDLVVIARPSIARADFHQVERDLVRALRQGRLLDAATPPAP